MSMGPARERVRVARALPELPAISAAFCKGKVSYSKVRAMTRVATPKNEAKLLQVALHGTASHVETQVRLYRKTKRIEALEEENLRHGHRELSWYIDDDGYWVFKGRFTAEQGVLLQKALEAAGDQLFEEQQHVPGDVYGEIDNNIPLDRTSPEPISQKRADELARVVEGFLAGAGSDQSGGDKYMVNIHSNIETLKEDGNGAEAEIEDRAHVAQASLSTGIPRWPRPVSRPGYPGQEAGLGHVFAITSKNQKNGLKITPRTAVPQWHGEQMDHWVAVDMLLQCEGV